MFAASKSGRVVAAAATDPYFPYVPLLLETTSTNGQQNNTFLDSSTNNFTITRNGTPTQGSVTPYWPDGQWGNYFNGTTDYFGLGSQTNLQLSNSDFTIETWIYPQSTGVMNIFGNLNDSLGSGSYWFIVNLAAGSLFQFATGTGINVLKGSGKLSLNNWHHIAVTRSGSNIRLYLDGAQVGTTDTSIGSGTITSSGNAFTIGRASIGSVYYVNGYLSNLRLVVGTPLYTGSTYTVPTTPLSPISGTQLLTCQSNRFRDNSANIFTITANGTPRVQAFQPFSPTASYTAAAYGGSGYFNGSTDYLTTPITASGPLDISTTTTYTIEGWVYWTASAGNKDVWTWGGKQTGGPSSYYQLYWATTGNVLKWEQGSTSGVLTTVTTSLSPALNTWYHIAIVRSGSSITVYANGQSVGTGTYAPNDQQFAEFCLGSLFYNTGYVQFFSGYISNFRFVKGTAVYTGAFTPPTAPVTAITNTSLLLNSTNAGIYDAAVQNNAITAGDAQASISQYKWSPTSMRFDGTGDYLSFASNPAFAFGTGDFTMECWIYATAASDSPIYEGRASGTGATGFTLTALSSTVIRVFTNGTAIISSSGTTYLNIWTYVAVVRASGTTTLYINGSSVGTSAGMGNLTDTTPLIGAGRYTGSTTPSAFFTGYIQDFRFTKGYARTITTPTAAFPTR
jgi:hypothetical protein